VECLWISGNAAQQLLTYTIGLLILIATLAIPVPWALFRGFTKHNKEHAFRWRQVLALVKLKRAQ
jgi:hypothetical protein